ncbi:hypothetical protein O181_102066 [Austropuccinia psidii MF-1]|uniref:Uncharacterized protein n=1 Tax=Austropuccinia psidii MF-1 TaxID=1389203 RepID=A0A9Q3JI58_9BASI|nr:hypothetical protein [Austropuccinia psidii MF-1]
MRRWKPTHSLKKTANLVGLLNISYLRLSVYIMSSPQLQQWVRKSILRLFKMSHHAMVNYMIKMATTNSTLHSTLFCSIEQVGVGKVYQCKMALGAEMRNKGILPPSESNKLPPKSKAAGKEFVRRELRSVVTSGTIVNSSILTADAATSNDMIYFC